MDLQIQNRLALVTGASKNIGRAIATRLAQEGANLILVARSEDQLEAVRKEIATPDRPHHAYVIDLMADGGVARLIESITKDTGAPDIMVHNLGGSFGLTAFSSAADWQKVWYFNVGIGHELNRAFIPEMVKKRWGRIVHLSTQSTETYLGYPPYTSAKCAVNGYVKGVNREVSKDNVIISAVSPGTIRTEGRYFAKMEKENPVWIEQYFDNHLPTRRLGTPEDVAGVVAFLSSEYASFMAGSIVGVDGGGM